MVRGGLSPQNMAGEAMRSRRQRRYRNTGAGFFQPSSNSRRTKFSGSEFGPALGQVGRRRAARQVAGRVGGPAAVCGSDTTQARRELGATWTNVRPSLDLRRRVRVAPLVDLPCVRGMFSPSFLVRLRFELSLVNVSSWFEFGVGSIRIKTPVVTGSGMNGKPAGHFFAMST